MTNIYALLAIFAILTGCDLLTTWLDLFRLPKELRGQESNPVFGNDVTLHWKHAIVWKVCASSLIGLAAWKRNDVFPLEIVDICLFLVVLNNFFIFATRKFWKRKTATLGGVFTQVCKTLHLPKQLAYFFTVALLGVASWGLALLIR